MALATALFMMGIGVVCGESAVNASLESAVNASLESAVNASLESAANISLESATNTSLESFPEEHECCIYHGFSEELFTECCKSVGDCPDCPPISRGLDSGPVDFNYCLDHNGVLRMEGSEWLTTPCIQCHCQNGLVTCLPIRPVCPLPPQPYCRELPGDCCPTWDCTQTNGCVDDAGVHHEEGTSWSDSRYPCTIYYCTASGIVTLDVPCPLLPPQPHPRCTIIIVGCCQQWNCTGCVDDARVHHEEGTSWSDSRYPCTIYYCTASGIVTLDVPCPPLPPQPHPRCTIIIVGCCQQWNCTSGCVDEFGNQRVEGEQWVDPSDPCYTLTCTPTGIQRSLTPCPTLPPQPHYACRVEHIGCCRNWTCDGCVDDAGDRHDEGTSWSDSRDPCTIYFCTASGIVTQDFSCQTLPPLPHPRCTSVIVNCCEEWKCMGCVDYGVHRDVDDIWNDETDECTRHTCTEHGIISFKLFCPPPPPRPSGNCNLVTVHCCQEWDCFKPSGCVDSAGVHHEQGTSWTDPRDPCTIYFCTVDGIVTIAQSCQPLPPQPRPRCTKVMVDCCPEWRCTGECVDGSGVHHGEGCTWKDSSNPCVEYLCTNFGIFNVTKPCLPLPPQPHSGCSKVQEGCCEEWDCSFGCPDLRSVGLVCTQVVSHDQCYTHSDCPGELCCPVGACGNICIPVTKPGTCPLLTLQPSCLYPRDQCKSDTDCPGIQKCCLGPCGNTCSYPIL